ncbi:MAG: PilZ domain-containing protein [Candidatus Omnitrophica bacterium]|nr:PilZ domain-containing protein [Candidatus Omnitrophota bacterium]
MEEKRKEPRIKDRVIVHYEIGEGRKIEQEVASRDISMTGIQISIERNLKDDFSRWKKLELQLCVLEDVIPFILKGEVAWIKEDPEDIMGRYLVGIEFISVDEFQKERLKKYINRKT